MSSGCLILILILGVANCMNGRAMELLPLMARLPSLFLRNTNLFLSHTEVWPKVFLVHVSIKSTLAIEKSSTRPFEEKLYPVTINTAGIMFRKADRIVQDG